MQQNVGIETDTEGHAEGDGARPRAGENNEVTRAMKEMTTALVNTIKESNRAINQNLNNVLEQVQRRQAAERVITAQNRSNRTERGRYLILEDQCIVGQDFQILMKTEMIIHFRGSRESLTLCNKGR